MSDRQGRRGRNAPIPKKTGKTIAVRLRPRLFAFRVMEAIARADLILIRFTRLAYTSILAELLVVRSWPKRLNHPPNEGVIANLMTQTGETEGFFSMGTCAPINSTRAQAIRLGVAKQSNRRRRTPPPI